MWTLHLTVAAMSYEVQFFFFKDQMLIACEKREYELTMHVPVLK